MRGSVRRIPPAARKTSASGRPGPGRQVAAEVRALACGLAAQGFRRGMHLAIIGDNRPRLYWSMLAAQALGGIPVPMYQDAPAAEFVFVLMDAEIGYAIVEDQEQVDKMLEAVPQVPSLQHIYYDDPRGLRNYENITSFERLQEIGREFDAAHPGWYDDEIARGRAGRRIGHALHVGHHRQAQGRVPDARGLHRVGARRLHVRPTDRRRQHPVVPADGVGRRSPVLARAVDGRRLHDQLSRIRRHGDDGPARDRPDLLFRAAARVRESAHAGDDPDGGRKRGQARRLPSLHGGRKALRRRDPRRQARLVRRSAAIRARQRPRVRPAAQRARHEPHPRRVHGGCRDRPRPLPLLPLDRHQPEAALRLDRDVRLRVPAARRRDPVRLRRQAGARRRAQDRGQRRSAGARSDAAQGILQATGRDRRIDRRRRLLPHRRRRRDRRGRATEDHRPREGRRQDGERRDVRAQLHREQAQVLSAYQGGGRLRQRTRRCVRVRQHRHGLGRQLGGAPQYRVLGLHRSRAKAGSHSS